MRRATLALALVALLAAPAAASAARTVHVELTGADAAGCGPTASPCRSIGYAVAHAHAHDTIVLGPGRFEHDRLRLHVDVPHLTIAGAGSGATELRGHAEYLLLLGEHADGFRLRGVELNAEDDPRSLLEVAGRAVVNDVVLDDVSGSGLRVVGVPESATIGHWRLTHVDFAGRYAAVGVDGLVHDLTIAHSSLHHGAYGLRVRGPIAGVSNARNIHVVDVRLHALGAGVVLDGVDGALLEQLRFDGVIGVKVGADGTRTRDVRIRHAQLDATEIGVRATATHGGTFAGLHLDDVSYAATTPERLVTEGVTGVTVTG